jgi:hypothetical protein
MAAAAFFRRDGKIRQTLRKPATVNKRRSRDFKK